MTNILENKNKKKKNMCGFWALFGLETDSIACVCDNFSKISHRGPDSFQIEFNSRVKVS